MSRFNLSRFIPVISVLAVVLLGLSACTRAGPASPPVAAAIPSAPVSSAQMVVHKSPQCGCCGMWVQHMRQAGFDVEVRESNDLTQLKQALGVPSNAASCHTAEIGGYVIEGHVPAEDVRRLLTERPIARGLAAPGMPMGSPGMPAPAGHGQPYDVLLIAENGSASVYARHGN